MLRWVTIQAEENSNAGGFLLCSVRLFEHAASRMAEAMGNVWVELVGNVIIARVRGTADVALIRSCHERVLELARSTGCGRILYDALEMERPALEVAITQQGLTPDLDKLSVRIALVVPNSGIAYLSRIAFNDGNHRVFYHDISGAFAWLAETD